MDDPIPIDGIIDGDPESLAAVCAAGGSAIAAYCSAIGAQAHMAETVVTALAQFRRGVVDSPDQEPSQLEELLLTVTDRAARRIAGIDPSPLQQAAARMALENAVTAPLAAGLAPRVIRSLVEVAPVTALGGDAAAVRRATEQHYVRAFDGLFAAAPGPPAAPEPPARGGGEGGGGAWLPPDLLVEATASGADSAAGASDPRRSTSKVGPVITEPAAADAQPAATPAPPELPGAHWRGGPERIWKRWRARRGSHRASASGRGRRRSALIAGVLGLAIGAGVVAVALPQKTVRPTPILVRPLDIPFTVNGAVFNVARTNAPPWALRIRQRPLRPGHSWLTLSTQTRNLSRANFHPRGLGYRLRTPSGLVIGPETAEVPPSVTAARGRLPVGQRSSVHLGFQVPRAQRDLALEFDPALNAPRIRVPLN